MLALDLINTVPHDNPVVKSADGGPEEYPAERAYFPADLNQPAREVKRTTGSFGVSYRPLRSCGAT
jgi:hypothetical protein